MFGIILPDAKVSVLSDCAEVNITTIGLRIDNNLINASIF